eukprot:TRINITY_DN4020_c5_g1_i1.p1 TRINITY_DN4020_c5_g1~~TRINITY_DN4020_c5_g1_i1.p1  ORF type:complete len:160 (+),score=29.08 TRINITY_DN4020_c5_g1_i1:443-922(+)
MDVEHFNEDEIVYDYQAMEDPNYVKGQTELGLGPGIEAFLAVFFGWLGAIAILFVEKTNLYVVSWGWQSLIFSAVCFLIQCVLYAIMSIIYVATGYLSGVYIPVYIIWGLYSLMVLFMCYLAFVNGNEEDFYALPVIGDWAIEKAQYHCANGGFKFLQS